MPCDSIYTFYRGRKATLVTGNDIGRTSRGKRHQSQLRILAYWAHTGGFCYCIVVFESGIPRVELRIGKSNRRDEIDTSYRS